ncbi:MAG TPA: hypothetical protein VF671_17465 [Pseudomonas sp.]|jgi:hypothetical protein|uniref:hypothetical protein n=1 Tax=Pseudomonas sp. TaxID=306 RepID=UPI002EDAEEA3
MRNGLRASYVNGNSLLFFADQASLAFQEDVLISTLYCQLAASAKHSAFNEAADWRQRYFNALTSFRCTIVYRDVQNLPLDPDETIWARLKGMLGKRVSAALIEAAETAITNLTTHADHEASALLRKQTVQLDSHNDPDSGTQESKEVYDVALQLGFMDATPTMHLVLFSFKSASPVSGLPLADLFSSSVIIGDLHVAIVSAELDEHDFGYFRQGLLDKLGSRREALCMEIAGVDP